MRKKINPKNLKVGDLFHLQGKCYHNYYDVIGIVVELHPKTIAKDAIAFADIFDGTGKDRDKTFVNYSEKRTHNFAINHDDKVELLSDEEQVLYKLSGSFK